MLSPETVIFTILFLTCALYAIVLEGLHNRYIPDHLIFTVIFGDGLIWLALANIEQQGVPLTAWVVLKALLVGGVPIAIWQVWQYRNRRNGRKR